MPIAAFACLRLIANVGTTFCARHGDVTIDRRAAQCDRPFGQFSVSVQFENDYCFWYPVNGERFNADRHLHYRRWSPRACCCGASSAGRPQPDHHDHRPTSIVADDMVRAVRSSGNQDAEITSGPPPRTRPLRTPRLHPFPGPRSIRFAVQPVPSSSSAASSSTTTNLNHRWPHHHGRSQAMAVNSASSAAITSSRPAT